MLASFRHMLLAWDACPRSNSLVRTEVLDRFAHPRKRGVTIHTETSTRMRRSASGGLLTTGES